MPKLTERQAVDIRDALHRMEASFWTLLRSWRREMRIIYTAVTTTDEEYHYARVHWLRNLMNNPEA